ncbi:MAG: Xaa-Pro peptidase family protein, partial [Acidaminobacteraceae bacterium]
MTNNRISKLLKSMADNNVSQGLISSPSSIFYLTNTWVHPGERLIALLVSKEKAPIIIANKLFALPGEINGIKVVTYDDIDYPIELIYDYINSNETFAIDDFWPSKFLIDLLKLDSTLTFTHIAKLLSNVQMIKDQVEIEKLTKASNINDKVMSDIFAELSSGKNELELTDSLLSYYKNHNTTFSFDPILCFGRGTSEPHHITDNTLPSKNCAVIADIGGFTDNYCSDMTRSFFIGEPDDEYIIIYKLVLEANLAAIASVAPGVKLSDIDKAARSIIEKAGYGKYFTHRTGHGIGISVHELPDVSSNSDIEVSAGMV